MVDLRSSRRRLAVALAVAVAGALYCTKEAVGPPPPPPAPPQLAFIVQPANVDSAQPIAPPVQVAIQDSLGHTMTGAQNTVTLALRTNPGGAKLSGSMTANAVNGVARFANVRLDRPGTGYTLMATADTVTAATSAPFSVRAPSLPKLAFIVQPANVDSGRSIAPPVQVTIQDSLGHTITSATNTITLALGANPGGATLSGRLSVPAVNGVATFADLGLDRPASGYTLTATSGALTSATSGAFMVRHVTFPARKLAFTVQPSDADSAQPIAPAVQVAIQDSLGRTVTTATNTVILALGTNPGGAALSGTLSVPAVNGVANFTDLRLSRSGNGYTLTATSGTLIGATSASLSVRSIPSSAAFAVLSAGGIEDSGGHTCGRTTSGAGYCWGYNGHGQLGDATRTQRVTPKSIWAVGLAQLSAGGKHTCGVSNQGVASCWGDNSYGQLGDGTSTDRTSPVSVLGGLSFATISAGKYHSCAVTAAGLAYCWGYNSDGELGDGTSIDKPSPVAVAGGRTFAAVSAGGAHSCGIDKSGVAYCWGYNGNGELGDGTMTSRTSPVRVAGGLTFKAISSADFFTCGLTTSGAAYCWGFNIDGELGDGTQTVSTTPTPVVGGLTFVSISASNEHTCAVTTGGDMYCWGYNCAGQLGNGSLGDQASPVLVLGGLNFASVSVAGIHSCGVTTSGVAYCWGYNGDGELGDGTTTTPRMTPVRVATP